jgi:holo-[acyl-carrier protein] synthase
MIEVERIRRAMERHGERFYRRFFTQLEQDQCCNLPGRLAARFAAKEATSKALGTGIGDICWVDIEVRSDERGRPYLVLYDSAVKVAAELGISNWQLSLSHTQDYAIAFVVGTSEPIDPII